MQDITEQQDRAQEISDAISRPFGEVYDEVKLINLKFFCTKQILIIVQKWNTPNLLWSVRMICWQSCRSWKTRIWRKVWRAWVDFPVCPAPNFPQHAPVSAHVSNTTIYHFTNSQLPLQRWHYIVCLTQRPGDSLKKMKTWANWHHGQHKYMKATPNEEVMVGSLYFLHINLKGFREMRCLLLLINLCLSTMVHFRMAHVSALLWG